MKVKVYMVKSALIIDILNRNSGNTFQSIEILFLRSHLFALLAIHQICWILPNDLQVKGFINYINVIHVPIILLSNKHS